LATLPPRRCANVAALIQLRRFCRAEGWRISVNTRFQVENRYDLFLQRKLYPRVGDNYAKNKPASLAKKNKRSSNALSSSP
jgi:hypothetical protein